MTYLYGKTLPCREWPGPFGSSGHPRMVGGKRSPARVLFEETHGRPPLIRNLISLCGNKLCVLPEHHADTVAAVVAWRQEPDGDCLRWTGVQVKGYGWFRLGEVFVRPHRWIWEEAHGPIPDELVIDHTCNNPLCLRLEHLRCVTQGENGTAAHSNSPAGVHARKTHCVNGHPFDEENTSIEHTRYGRGWTRVCRACRRERRRKQRHGSPA